MGIWTFSAGRSRRLCFPKTVGTVHGSFCGVDESRHSHLPSGEWLRHRVNGRSCSSGGDVGGIFGFKFGAGKSEGFDGAVKISACAGVGGEPGQDEGGVAAGIAVLPQAGNFFSGYDFGNNFPVAGERNVVAGFRGGDQS